MIVRLEDVWVRYPLSRSGLLSTTYLYAVNGVTLGFEKGKIEGVIGESGSGKSTLGRTALRLIQPYRGKVYWDDIDVTKLPERKLRKLRKDFQLIQQDPYGALDPRLTVYDIVSEGLRVHKLVSSKEEEREIVLKTLASVKLSPPEVFAEKKPDELSGGQRQRVAIARALVMRPKFIVADEPVSMLDASTRGQILEIIKDIRDKYGTSMMFITHDIAIASYISDTISVIYGGTIVERADSDTIVKKPLHPYTMALIQAVPNPDPDMPIKEPNIKGEVEPILGEPKGCVFYKRCPLAKDICKTKKPQLREVENGHYVACHLV